MNNSNQKTSAVRSSLKRAESQNQGKVEARLFTPHVASSNGKSVANHQNYFRS